MGKLIWLGILIGIVLGPCYYLYTRYVSGTVAQETMVYGADLKARKNAWMTPVKVHLEPSMNPIAFDLAISDSPDLQTSNPVNHYTMSLAEGDKILWSFDWALGYTKTRKRGYVPNYSNRLRVFSVSQAGDYSFNVKPESEGGINLREMTLKVKTNVVQRNDAVVGFGFVLMGVFIGIGWLRLKSLDARRR